MESNIPSPPQSSLHRTNRKIAEYLLIPMNILSNLLSLAFLIHHMESSIPSPPQSSLHRTDRRIAEYLLIPMNILSTLLSLAFLIHHMEFSIPSSPQSSLRVAEYLLIPMNIIGGNLPRWPSVVDLRYALLGVLNLFLIYADLNMEGEGIILKLVFSLLLVTLFLFISIQLHLRLRDLIPLHVRRDDPIPRGVEVRVTCSYSIPLTILLALSILKPLLFWLACLTVILTSKWHKKFWIVFKYFLRSILRFIPPIVVWINLEGALDAGGDDDDEDNQGDFASAAVVAHAQMPLDSAEIIYEDEIQGGKA